MKLKHLFLMSLVFCSLVARQEQETFLKAGLAYQEGDVAQALTLYDSLPVKSAGTLYNLGNCAYRLGDYGRAVGYWFQALPKAPRFMYPWLFLNIEQVYEKLSLPALSFWQIASLYMQSYLSLLCMQLMSLFFALCFVVLWFRCALRWWSSLLLVVGMVVFVAGSFVSYKFWYEPHVVIIERVTNLYTGPDEHFPVMKEIPLGMRARVVGFQDSWYKISYLKNRGWVKQSCVMNIL